MRGISGVFYDHLRPQSDEERNKFFHLMQKIGNSFLPIYTELSLRNKDKTYNVANKKWQFIRRGRYAEFNLVYDRGTHFGLKTNGRIESILMSLPPVAEWEYDYHPKMGTDEEKTLKFFQPQDWI
jgi:coproporphyrinogen III oxidase